MVYHYVVKLMLFLVQIISFMYLYCTHVQTAVYRQCSMHVVIKFFSLSGTCSLWILRLVQRLQIMRFGLILWTFFCHCQLKQGVYSLNKREMLYCKVLGWRLSLTQWWFWFCFLSAFFVKWGHNHEAKLWDATEWIWKEIKRSLQDNLKLRSCCIYRMITGRAWSI